MGDIVGTIRRRLLVNSWVDPAEVAPLLPDRVRPHLGTTGGVVVGCCMIEIESARPWPVPRRLGVNIRAAAHRISVEIGPSDAPMLAVYVPVRHTDSKPAVLAGGRVFPGVHEQSTVVLSSDATELSWKVTSRAGGSDGFDIAASVSLEHATAARSEVADIVVGTVLGLSPGRRVDGVEAVEMRVRHTHAEIVELTNLESDFLEGFSTGVPADSLLMTDVDVTWRPDRRTAESLSTG